MSKKTSASSPDKFHDVLQEPIIHATTGNPLPVGDWLLAQWVAEDSHGPGRIACEQCGNTIYDMINNVALQTWVETGLKRRGGNGIHMQTWCLRCFATTPFVWPRMLTWWALFQDGPLPLYHSQDSKTPDEIDAHVREQVAKMLEEQEVQP